MSRMGKGLALLLLLAGLGIIATVFLLNRAMNARLSLAEGSEVLWVSPGLSLAGLVRELERREILCCPRAFTLIARISGDATRIKAGEYLLAAGMTADDLLRALVQGDVIKHSFTIIEGWTVRELLQALATEEALEQDMLENYDSAAESLMDRFGESGLHAEGQFLPETYQFVRGERVSDVLRRAHADLLEQLEQAWQGRESGLPFDTSYEALVLASIVEKETALAAERPVIAGVFVRRLQQRMRLQTDPTVIYGLGPKFDGNLTRQHLDTDTPYNTYTRAGLPPTPIALPGARAIVAVMHPEPGDALYFVATGAGDGGHHFSATLEEHNQAVQDYLRQLRQNRKNP